MSYRGRPSKGCDACRSRKVKCDEAKPVCTRCSNSGYECKYRDPTDLIFRNQTSVAAQRAEDSWRKRSKSHQRARSESSASHIFRPNHQLEQTYQQALNGPQPQSFISSNSTKQKTSSISLGKQRTTPIPSDDNSTIAPAINSDLERLAYERFIYDFVVPENPNRPPEEPSDALYTFVPLLYQHAPPDSCLATIVKAVSYINFSNRHNSPQAAILAGENFGKGLKLLSNMIADKTQAVSNDTLCSVLLMGVFEVRSQTLYTCTFFAHFVYDVQNLSNTQRRGNFAGHQQGVNALLQLRTIEQYYNNTISARLYGVGFTQMLLASLQVAKHPPLPVQGTLSLPNHLSGAYNESDYLSMRLVWREAQLHASWHELKRSATPPISRYDLQNILQTALELDADYEAWENALPIAWKHRIEPNSPEVQRTYDSKWQQLVLGSRGAPSEIRTYSSLKRCYMGNFCRTSRMFLLRDTLEILNWIFRMPEPDVNVSTLHGRTDSAQVYIDPDQNANKNRINSLSDLDLRIFHSSATTLLVRLIEEGCSAILGSFTVPVESKSLEDVMGMRGYVILWPLGTMDSILSSGLVPESGAFTTPTVPSPSLSRISPPLQSAPPTVQTRMHPLHHHGSIATEHGSSATPHIPPQPQQRQSTSLPHTPTQSPPNAQYSTKTAAKKGHTFECNPRHPYDLPVELPSLDFNIIKPKAIDVVAKREWLNSILYYIGAELGIKKALAVPLMEGYMPIVKPRVDGILGR